MISFGSDPEFMLTKDGEFYSAIGIVKGSAKKRIKKDGHEFYWDNVMAECAIKPGFSRDEAISNIGECLRIYAGMVEPYKLTLQASQEYPTSQLKSKAAKTAGCSPDWCAYRLKQMKAPKKQFQTGVLRCCGGHIHLGQTTGVLRTSLGRLQTVLLLDLFLGVPSLFIDKDPTSVRRRTLYGEAGRYRTQKKYGVEYRSLSNFWLGSPALVGLVYDLCNWVVDLVDQEGDEWWKFDEEVFIESDTKADAWTCMKYDPVDLKRTIDKANLDSAKKYLQIVMDHLPTKLCKEVQRQMVARRENFYRVWALDSKG
jgi:hypothetical protein